MHYWGVWHGKEPIENFKENVGRFIAEYGYQSFPDYATLLKVMEESDMNLEAEIMKNRQKSYIGNGIIEENIKKYAYDEPDFATWIKLSQLVQAHAMGFAIRQHRIQTPKCMGTLFWQLNDCWPGPSWSVIDYYGQEKEAYKAVQQYYQPVIASLELTEGKLVLTVVSDTIDTTETAISVSLKKANGKEIYAFNEKRSLSFLQPVRISLKAPKRIEKKLLKRKDDFYIEIKLRRGDLLIFGDTYYLRTNATVNFPTEKAE